MKRKPFTFSFVKHEFETIYRTRLVTTVHHYTTYLSLIFACMLVVFLLTDVAINPADVPTSVKVLYLPSPSSLPLAIQFLS
jgi:hypothetical protein